MGATELWIAFGVPALILCVIPVCVTPNLRRVVWNWLPPLALCGSWFALELRQELLVSLNSADLPRELVRQSMSSAETALRAWIFPSSARYWLPWIVGVGCWSWSHWHPATAPWQFLWMTLLAACIPLRLLWGSVYLTQQWSWPWATIVVLGWGIAIAYAMAQARDLKRSKPAWQSPLLVLVVVALTEATVLALSGSQVLGLMTLVVAGTGFAGITADWMQHSREPASPPWQTLATSLVLAMASLGLLGVFYADMTVSNGLLLFFAGVLPWHSHRFQSSSTRLWSLALSLGPLVLLACAVGLAARQFWIAAQGW